MFIVFEGIDGSGKDTQVRRYGEWLEEQGTRVAYEVEPTQDSDAGREIYALLERSEGSGATIDELDTEEVLRLYLDDRYSHTKKIRKLLAAGKVVISSRYDISSYAYQTINTDSVDLKTDFERIYKLHQYSEKTLIPTHTFYFSLSVNTAWERIEARFKESGMRHGFEKIAVLQKVEERYLAAIDYIRSRDERTIVVIDATRSPEEITAEIRGIMEVSAG